MATRREGGQTPFSYKWFEFRQLFHKFLERKVGLVEEAFRDLKTVQLEV